MKKTAVLMLAMLLAPSLAFATTCNETAYSGIKELGDLPAASVAAGDYVPVCDVSTGRAVKVPASGLPFTTPIRVFTDAVASGQTSKTVTASGVTAASDCVATANEVATNAVYIRAAVAGTDQVVVTTSGDPGASNMDFTVACFN